MLNISVSEQSLLIFLGIDNLEKKEDLEKSTLTIRKKDTLRDLEEFFAPIEMEINDLCSEYHQSIKPPKYNKNNNVNLSKLESTTKIIQPSNNTKEYDNNNNLTSTTNNNNNDFEKTFLTDTQKLPQDQKNDFQKLQQNNTNNPQQLTTSQNNTAQQQNTPTQQHSTLQHNNNTQQTEKCVGCMKAITERYLLKVRLIHLLYTALCRCNTARHKTSFITVFCEYFKNYLIIKTNIIV